MKKIALVGLGYLGKIHLRILCEGTGWELSGIYDINTKLRDELAAQYQVKAFSSLEELLENCDAVDIVTPSNTHFEIAEKCIMAGKHVFIEKPVTSELKDAKRLRDLSLEAGVIIQVGHVERFNPAFIAAKEHLQDPKYIEIQRLAQYNNRGTDVSVVLDLMLHDLDLLLSLIRSNVKKIQAIGTPIVSRSADMANVRIEFDNGCVANITTNRVSLKNVRKFNVFTPKKLVSIDLLDKITHFISVKDASLNSKNIVLDPGNGQTKKEIIFEHPIILPTNAIKEELVSFYKSISSNKQAVVGIDDSIRVMEIAKEIEEKINC